MRPIFLLSLALAISTASLGCNDYDAPPQISVADLKDGILPDPTAPLVLQFHEPIKPESLHVRLIRLQTDQEGNVAADAEQFFDSADGVGAVAALSEDRRTYSISLMTTLPVGPQLAFEVASGLSDDGGHSWKVTQLIKFGFVFDCGDAGMTASTFPSGAYFLVATVDEPLMTQLQLLADIRVNPDDGTFIGQFTNADRDPAIDCSQFGLNCSAEEVCRTLPEPGCAKPSDEATGSDEYPDYVAVETGETGYSFTAEGCVRDQEDGSWTFANAPTDVHVSSPPVTVKGIAINASIARDEAGVLRGDGTFTADDIFLGVTPSGAGAGTVAMRDVPADEVKPGLPPPPEP